jgi:hypothetical protein
MKKSENKPKSENEGLTGIKEKVNEGYPLYPSSDDIYSKSKEEKDVNPENISEKKSSNKSGKRRKNNEMDFSDDVSGGDLDIPGSELDDQQENIGSEDEENNFYSLGGDDHNDLDEDNG